MVDPLRLRLAGLSYLAIAKRMRVSPQRIAQLLAPPLAIRRIVIERARGRCASCGCHVGRSGRIHHRSSRGMTCSQYNDLGNLVLLCAQCYRRPCRTRMEQMRASPQVVTESRTARVRLGHQIMLRRREQQLTQKQLAARAQIGHAYLARIERGGRRAGREVLARIARALRCSAAELRPKFEPPQTSESGLGPTAGTRSGSSRSPGRGDRPPHSRSPGRRDRTP